MDAKLQRVLDRFARLFKRVALVREIQRISDRSGKIRYGIFLTEGDGQPEEGPVAILLSAEETADYYSTVPLTGE